jgi:two-component system response regulator AtoC
VRSAPPRTFDVVISDLRMPNLDGIGLLRALTVHEPNLPVILLTAHGSVDSAVEAVKLGAFDYLEKPFDRDQIHQIVQKAIATRDRAGPSAPRLRRAEELEDPCTHAGMVGRSAQMHAIREIVAPVAASPSTVLITGESGTGKELVARALHLGSPRRAAPSSRSTAPRSRPGLVESELFGHERGPSPAPCRRDPAASSSPTAARCSSTRSARSPKRSRSSCCGRSRSRNSSASAASRPCAYTSA